MLLQFIRSMLGPVFGPVLDFILENPAPVASFLAVWLIIYAAGRLQLRHIERQTERLVTEAAQEIVVDKPHITSRGLYKRIYVDWSQQVRQWGWFVPHRLDLWPVPARSETVQHKFGFSPEWIAAVLDKHGIRLDEHE
jgi:hypothetical protein